MVRPDKIASRYAKAIFDSLKDSGRVVALIGELERFQQLVESNEELRTVLTSALFPAAERCAVVQDVAGKLELSETAVRVLAVITEAKRADRLPGILSKLHLNVLDAGHRIPMRVAAAVTLTSDEQKQLEQRFHKVLGREVEASYGVDESLIAGLRVTAGSRTFDGSVSGWLARFEEQLVGGTI